MADQPEATPACLHCGKRPQGAEGTVWCPECLAWYREQWHRTNNQESQ